MSGETPEDAVRREAREGTGVDPTNLKVVRQGINPYNRYCYLLSGRSDALPGTDLDPQEVAWAVFMPIAELHAKNETGELTFVDGFFEDIEHALAR